MTKEQMIVAIIVAIIGAIGASIGGGFAFAQFLIKRKDEKEEKDIQKQIDESIEAAMTKFIAKCGEIGDEQIARAKDQVRLEFQEGLKMRGDEGRERFDINSKQIEKNAETVEKLLRIQEEQAKKVDLMMDSLTSLNSVSKACAEGVKSTLYDKICIVAEKAIKRKGITIAEKANIKQLYKSYSDLNGNGKGAEYAETCLNKLEIITNEEAARRDSQSTKAS